MSLFLFKIKNNHSSNIMIGSTVSKMISGFFVVVSLTVVLFYKKNIKSKIPHAKKNITTNRFMQSNAYRRSGSHTSPISTMDRTTVSEKMGGDPSCGLCGSSDSSSYIIITDAERNSRMLSTAKFVLWGKNSDSTTHKGQWEDTWVSFLKSLDEEDIIWLYFKLPNERSALSVRWNQLNSLAFQREFLRGLEEEFRSCSEDLFNTIHHLSEHGAVEWTQYLEVAENGVVDNTSPSVKLMQAILHFDQISDPTIDAIIRHFPAKIQQPEYQQLAVSVLSKLATLAPYKVGERIAGMTNGSLKEVAIVDYIRTLSIQDVNLGNQILTDNDFSSTWGYSGKENKIGEQIYQKSVEAYISTILIDDPEYVIEQAHLIKNLKIRKQLLLSAKKLLSHTK